MRQERCSLKSKHDGMSAWYYLLVAAGVIVLLNVLLVFLLLVQDARARHRRSANSGAD